jgi:hypothetical protein
MDKWLAYTKSTLSQPLKDPHMEWASKKAMVRQWSIADMRRLLRCAGDDKGLCLTNARCPKITPVCLKIDARRGYGVGLLSRCCAGRSK